MPPPIPRSPKPKSPEFVGELPNLSLDLPKILTVVDWNAKKGIVAKMAGETGIGAALIVLKHEYAKVPWEMLDPGVAFAKFTKGGKVKLEDLDKLEPLAKANLGKLKAVVAQLTVIEKLTDAIDTKWKTNKLIPAASRAHVGKMKVAARAFKVAVSVKTITDAWQAVRAGMTGEAVVKDTPRKSAMPTPSSTLTQKKPLPQLPVTTKS